MCCASISSKIVVILNIIWTDDISISSSSMTAPTKFQDIQMHINLLALLLKDNCLSTNWKISIVIHTFIITQLSSINVTLSSSNFTFRCFKYWPFDPWVRSSDDQLIIFHLNVYNISSFWGAQSTISNMGTATNTLAKMKLDSL